VGSLQKRDQNSREKSIFVLTGAGISVESGIETFRCTQRDYRPHSIKNAWTNSKARLAIRLRSSAEDGE
jgi:NAD-dependent SIR2 family protein deacetylase